MSVSRRVVGCQAEVSASSLSLVQRSPIECGVSECDRKACLKRNPWSTMRCCATDTISNLRSELFLQQNKQMKPDNKTDYVEMW